MRSQRNSVSGHVFVASRKRGDQRYAKYRLASGRQVQKKLGPAWTGRGRTPEGYLTKRTAEAGLAAILTDARRGETPDPGDRSRKTFREGCDEWLRYVEHERQRAPSTLRDYRNVVDCYLVPEFGAETPLDSMTTERIDSYRERLLAEAHLSRRSIQKVLVLLHGIMKRAKRRKWIATNPAEDAERVSVKRSGDFNVLTPDQVLAVARAAESEHDAATFTVAAFTGLRMGELRALRWADVDFAAQTVFVRGSYTNGSQAARAPKSGHLRSVPLIEQAIVALDGLSRRELFTEPGDLVFPGPTGDFLDDGPLRDRFYAALEAAELGHLRDGTRPIVFHDLRHTFGTLGAAVWPLHELQGYMGHADIQTTMIYVHHVPKAAAAAELSRVVRAAVMPSDEVPEVAA
jgi:integrase